MRTAAWWLSAAALLLAGAPPCGAEGGKKPPAPAPAAPPGPTLEDVTAAIERRDYDAAERLGDAALGRRPPLERRFPLLALSAQVKLRLRNYAGCLHRTEQYRQACTEFQIPAEMRSSFLNPMREVRAEALLALGREEDARAILVDLLRSPAGLWQADRAAYLDSVLESAGPVHVDYRYAGVDRDAPGLFELQRKAAGSLAKAMHRIRFWLEDPDLQFPPIVLRFADDDWHANTESGAAAWASMVDRGGAMVGVVTIGVGALLRGGDFEGNGTLAHELGHVLRGGGSGGPWASDWLEEGIAHWISGDIDLELPNYVLGWRVCPAHFTAGGGWPEFPMRAMPVTEAEIAALPEDAQRLYGALFFEHVERTRGLKNMRKLVCALIRARDPSEAILRETGKSTDEIFAAVSRGLAAWQERAWYEFEELERIRSLLHGNSWAEAEAACRKFMAAHTATHLLPVVRRGLFVALREQGRAAEARQVLADALESYAGWVRPWLLLEDLRLARAAGNRERVLEIGGLIQDHRTPLDRAARDEVIAALREASGAGKK